MDIAAQFLTELSRKHYGPISKALGITVPEIQAAEKAIAALEPHPGRAFQPAEPTVYARPDVFIVELEGELRVMLNEYYLPRISINGYYSDLARESDDPEARTYLKEKLRQTKWLLESLERRGSTLRRCAQAVLDTQRAFFEGRTTELAPMSLSSLAGILELHSSTVSRAVRDKFLQCRQGTYPLRYFFQPFRRAAGDIPAGGEAAADAASQGRGSRPPAQRPDPLQTAGTGGNPAGAAHRGQIPLRAGDRFLHRPQGAQFHEVKNSGRRNLPLFFCSVFFCQKPPVTAR